MSKELEGRNQAIYHMYARGKPIQAIANQYGISRQAASKIIARYGQDGAVTDDEYRTLHRAQLEGILDECVAAFYETPPPMYDVKGNMLVNEDGEPVRDQKLRQDWADQARKISESIRRLDATDLPRRKQIDADEARRQAEEWLASLPRLEVEED